MEDELRHILLHVDPAPDDHDLIAGWAADLVEAITAPSKGEAVPEDIRVAVVADVLSCLEIGLVTLGRAFARTVEGGERIPSPVTLFPFTPRGDLQSMDLAATAYQCLLELANTGAVEGIRDTNEDYYLPASTLMLRQALERGEWQSIVTLGGSPDTYAVIRDWVERRPQVTIVQPALDEEIGERVATLLRRLQPEDEDNFTPARRHAVYRAVQLEFMLLRLGLGS